MNRKLIPIAFAASMLVSACSDDQTDVINNGPEITFRTAVSRAQNIDAKNLKNFKVWAFAGGIDEDAAPFINGLTASKSDETDESNLFGFDHSVFWPSDIETLNFWALAPANDKLEINHNGQSLTLVGYEPARNHEEQLDLLAAYEPIKRSEHTGISVTLNFKHILSNILVSAKFGTGVKENREMKIKGAWLMNIGGKANANKVTDDKNEITWGDPALVTNYGKLYDDAKLLVNDGEFNFFSFNKDDVASSISNMLLIPQQLKAWNKDTQPNGAYIMLLCRVEATHPGTSHNGSDHMLKPGVTDGNHTHQLFPGGTEYNENAYGYTLVPIGDLWEPGKQYKYTLDICGKNSGAGVYPPVIIPELPGIPDPMNPGSGITIIPTPDEDKVGKPVLDYPIQFTVTVADWTEPTGWKPGTDMQ